jgi:hypothetical protein
MPPGATFELCRFEEAGEFRKKTPRNSSVPANVLDLLGAAGLSAVMRAAEAVPDRQNDEVAEPQSKKRRGMTPMNQHLLK